MVRARLAFMHYLYTNVIQNVIINRMYGAILLCLHAHYEVKQPPHHHSPLSLGEKLLRVYIRSRILFIIQFFWQLTAQTIKPLALQCAFAVIVVVVGDFFSYIK